MRKNSFLTNKFIIRLCVVVALALVATLFVKYDYFLYGDTIATVESVKTVKTGSKTGFDGTYEYEENYYTQYITAKIRNGEHKGASVALENECTGSNVYDLTYDKGDDLFIERVEPADSKAAGAGAGASASGSASSAASVSSESGESPGAVEAGSDAVNGATDESSQDGDPTDEASQGGTTDEANQGGAADSMSQDGSAIAEANSSADAGDSANVPNSGSASSADSDAGASENSEAAAMEPGSEAYAEAEFTGVITSQKRDFYVTFSVVLLLALFIIIGGKKSLLTILSLGLNLFGFYFVIVLYFKGYNMLLLSIPMTVIFAALLLIFMYGKNCKTWLALAATLITTAMTLAIAGVAINFGGNIDYDFLEYMIQPYDPADARCIFLAEILVGCMGAVMDVVVTIIVTIDEITLNNPQLEPKALAGSCRSVGDEVVGTMIAIMFFTNLAGGIPFYVLAMRNGIAIHTVLRYNCFFEIVRFLSGSIAVVLAVPVASLISILYYRRRLATCR